MKAEGKIGVIGTGAIGARFVRRILAHDLQAVAYDIDPKVLEPLAGAGAEIAQDAADLASRCDVIVTCVTAPADVEDAVLGPRGVQQSVRPGSLIVETTTSTPATTRKLASALASKNVAVVDAPVSRGVPAAENGTLSIMVGGDRKDIDRALPVLRLFGTDIIRTGALGTGHVAKALNMGVLGINFIATAEIMALGLASGLDRAKFSAEIDASDGSSFVSKHHYPKYVLTERYDSRFTLALMRKDVGIAAEIATSTGLPRPYLHRVVDFYDAITPGNPNGDNTLLFPFVETDCAPSLAAKISAADLIETLAATIHFGTKEAIALAEAAGLAAPPFLEVLQASSGGSRTIEKWLMGNGEEISHQKIDAWKNAAAAMAGSSLQLALPSPMTHFTWETLCRQTRKAKN